MSVRNLWLCWLHHSVKHPLLFIAVAPQTRGLRLPVVLIISDFAFRRDDNTLKGEFNFWVMFTVACKVILQGKQQYSGRRTETLYHNIKTEDLVHCGYH